MYVHFLHERVVSEDNANKSNTSIIIQNLQWTLVKRRHCTVHITQSWAPSLELNISTQSLSVSGTGGLFLRLARAMALIAAGRPTSIAALGYLFNY